MSARTLIEVALSEPADKSVKLVAPLVGVESWNHTDNTTGTLPTGTAIRILYPSEDNSYVVQVTDKQGVAVTRKRDGKPDRAWRFIVPTDQLAAATGREMGQAYDFVGKLIQFDAGELSDKQTIELFQKLVDSGTIRQLEGRYARYANALIKAGHARGELLTR